MYVQSCSASLILLHQYYPYHNHHFSQSLILFSTFIKLSVVSWYCVVHIAIWSVCACVCIIYAWHFILECKTYKRLFPQCSRKTLFSIHLVNCQLAQCSSTLHVCWKVHFVVHRILNTTKSTARHTYTSNTGTVSCARSILYKSTKSFGNITKIQIVFCVFCAQKWNVP